MPEDSGREKCGQNYYFGLRRPHSSVKRELAVNGSYMQIKCNPDLRGGNDPELGLIIPVETQMFCKVIVKQSQICLDGGVGLFADENIKNGRVVCIGGGQLFSDPTKLAIVKKDYAGVFDKNLFIAPIDCFSPSPNWFINHSCNPNLKIVGRLVLLARRDIFSGEELTLDYAVVATGDKLLKMKCTCGESHCRGTITGGDWKDAALYEKYYEEWPSFIQSSGDQHDR